MSLTAQAEALGEELREIGAAAAAVNSAAWSARVDPHATQGLVGAAVALGAPVGALYPGGHALRDDAQMLSQATDLEADVGEALRRAWDMRRAACDARAAAATAAAAAEAMLADAKTASDQAYASAMLGAALSAMADAECAIEILDQLIARLDYALAALSRVPDDLASAYETPYGHIRRGGVLPYSGDFLSGAA